MTTVTPASASATSGSLRMLTSATGLSWASWASWYMKHSSPSGAQRTCQSPKVSLTISTTSGCCGVAGAPALRRRPAPGRRRAGAGAAVAGASVAGAASGAGGRGRLLGGERGGDRQPDEGGQGQAETVRLHRRIASPSDCVCAGLSFPVAPVNGRLPPSAIGRAQVKRAPVRRPFPRLRDFPVGLGRTIGADATPDAKSGQARPASAAQTKVNEQRRPRGCPRGRECREEVAPPGRPPRPVRDHVAL